MAGEDEWGDEDFLNALIVATETASASIISPNLAPNPTINTNPVVTANPAANHLPPPPRPVKITAKPSAEVYLKEWDDFFADGSLDLFDFGGNGRVFEFSPPRELSQRVEQKRNFDGIEKDKDKEIDRLKKEMEKISRKLNRMEREHSELQQDRVKKEKELERAFSEILAKNVEIEGLKKEIFDGVSVPEKSRDGVSDKPKFTLKVVSPELLKDCIQTEEAINSAKASTISKTQACVLSNGQVEVPSPNERIIQGEYQLEESIKIRHRKAIGVQTEQNDLDPATKECQRIYKFSCKMLDLWGPEAERKWGRYFYSKLLGCCSTDLFILFRFIGIPSNINLDFLTNKTFRDDDWDDVTCPIRSVEAQKVSHLYSVLMKVRNEVINLDELVEALTELCVLGNIVIAYSSLRIIHAACRIFCFNQSIRRDNYLPQPSLLGPLPELEELTGPAGRPSSLSLSLNRQTSLIQSMLGIISSCKKTCVLVEAISVVNLILENSHPFLERDKLELVPSLACVSHLLTREIDLCVKRQAVKHLFLLLNCPNHLKLFCIFCDGGIISGESTHYDNDPSRLHQSIWSTLGGLADCIDHRVNNNQDPILCREVVILLAFLASSGKSGFEVLLNPLSKRGSFLSLIIDVLGYQMDVASSCESQEDFHKERAALIREALILLNRLSSNIEHSKATLRAITKSTSKAAMTFDTVSRICDMMGSKEGYSEPEIAHLATLFRTRLISFLQENHKS